MKNILVPIDFSIASKNALKFAIKIAHATKSKIILFHSMHPIFIPSDAGMVEYPQNLEVETQAELDTQLDELVELAKIQNVEAEKIIQKGFLGDTISDFVTKENIDLIFTGTNGAKGLDALFFGTNSVNIFENVNCPVFIVPEDAKYHSIKKIMYATDFQFGDIKEIDKICKLALPFNAEVIVTHVNTDPKNIASENDTIEWLSEMGELSINYKNISYKLIHNTNVIDALEEAIKKMNIDIICMSTFEKSFFKSLVSKSNTKEMAYHSTIPLIALHLKENNKIN